MTHQSREDDDQATGLPDLPELIFLDTNIVQNLHSFGELIFDRVRTPDLEKKLSTLGPRVTADIYALAELHGPSITTTYRAKPDLGLLFQLRNLFFRGSGPRAASLKIRTPATFRCQPTL